MRFLGSARSGRRYVFAKDTSGGIDGYIEVVRNGNGANIHAHLNVTGLDVVQLHKFDANCEGEAVAYKWHIHTLWHQDQSSAFLAGCSLAIAGNHYDPDFACGPNSEYNKDARCQNVSYVCNPTMYASNPLACERGDLSGKLGDMQVVNGIIEQSWWDPHYPAVDEERPEWNMLLHAVCSNKATPRVACAIAAPIDSDVAVDATVAPWVLVGVLLASLLLLYQMRHPLLFKHYPTNVVVAAVIAVLGLLLYQYVVIDSAL
ncbi:hypothetical protein ACHHYP_03574 [Achlya hypogyna]|uniref:Superoxide dismutase copper/zinc binding domain-containing protein n=1 Tax=Achlya hypogyna TaxID=1202772 RepID=A0A1V9ZQX9_ACHHY|nr:hypothetical protein ACHHYP_03574 [Achlya hypogyna]